MTKFLESILLCGKLLALMMIRKHGLSQTELTYRLLAHWVKPIGLQKIPDQFELYDLTNDPTESKNLWKDPKVKEVLNI